jgi:acyl-CoA reductase-like NAD-dependent aldehyde dehydrogenase
MLSSLKPDEALRREFRMLIGGELVSSNDGLTYTTTNPATGMTLPPVPSASCADVDRCVRAARAAHLAWRRMAYRERRAVVSDMAEMLRRSADLFGLLDCLDTGNIYAAMRLDALEAANQMEYFASIGHEIKGEVTHLDNNLHFTRREPFGVVLRLLPFNHPIFALCTAIIPPILTGNTVIAKPSPHTPRSALAFAEAVKDCLPPGVLNIIVGDNDRVSAPLIRHDGIDRICLTGSVETGRIVMRMAADRLVPVTLELGGKNPLIVFPDFDVDRAVDIAVAGMNFKWQSQSCASTSRILVHRAIKDRFTDCLAARVAKVRVGLPLEDDAEMGAITFEALYRRCLSYVQSGKDEGARLRCGGDRPGRSELQRGYFLSPAVFDDANPNMRIAREEIFGPIITVLAWDKYDEMIEIANGLSFGLTAVVATNDLNTALKTAEMVGAGYVEVNGPVSYALGSPVGGVKSSGIGREGNLDELLSFTQIKSVNVRIQR